LLGVNHYFIRPAKENITIEGNLEISFSLKISAKRIAAAVYGVSVLLECAGTAGI
jgi:hypothetical protein